MTKKIILSVICAAFILCCAACSPKTANTTLDLTGAQTAVEKLELYPNMMQFGDSDLQTMGLDRDKIQKYLISFPLMNVHAGLYAVILPKEGSEADVKAAMDEYMATYENTWSQYLPDQYELVKNRLMTEIKTSEGTYLVYIISDDNDSVLSAINSAVSESSAK